MPGKRLPTLPSADRPTLPDAVTASPGFLVGQVAGLFRARFEVEMRTHRLHPRQYLLMLVLRDEGTMSQQAAGQRLGMDRTTTMQAVLALADAGLVRREDDPNDRRVYRLALTETGAQMVCTLEERIGRAERELLAPLRPEDRDRFVAHLRAILSAADGGSCGTV